MQGKEAISKLKEHIQNVLTDPSYNMINVELPEEDERKEIYISTIFCAKMIYSFVLNSFATFFYQIEKDIYQISQLANEDDQFVINKLAFIFNKALNNMQMYLSENIHNYVMSYNLEIKQIDDQYHETLDKNKRKKLLVKRKEQIAKEKEYVKKVLYHNFKKLQEDLEKFPGDTVKILNILTNFIGLNYKRV
ncbi:MAG: hypothetical protein MJB14_02015 [Spirochaetes bacterium]|nr:hypothetical protein [Spirochaetota bacterium]